MSTLQKDFTIPGVACTSQEDQENMTLKVTLLSSEWKSSTNGDLSTINRELAIQLAKHPNVDVSVLLPNCSEADRSSAESHNVKLVEADRVPGFEPVLCLSFPPRDHTIDCVIGHGVHLGRPIASMKRNPNYSHCKWMQVVHSAPEEDGMYKDILEGQKMQETEIQLCKMADQVITIGPKLAEAYKCYLCPAKQEEKVFDLTPSIFSEFLAVEQATKQRRTFRILLIGSGDSCEDFNVKGYDIASKAISELKDESYKLKFVCAAGGKGDIVAENLLHHGISRNQLIVCSFDDNREVLANLFCEVDLAIMPSRTEGFGTTALEALSAGLPVLVSGNSGLGEVLKKVPLGPQSVVDSEDPKEWAREIKRVRQKERDVRLSESRFLREKYLEKYSWEEPCKSLVIKMKNLVFGKALHSSLDYEETKQNKQGESIPGAVPRDSTKQAQRNAKEAWTAADKAPNTSLKGKRTDGDEQTKSVQGHLNDMAQKYLVTRDVLKEFDLTELKLTTTIQGEEYIAARKFLLQGSEKAPNTSLERKRTDGNEEAKSVQGNLPHSGVQVGKRDGREQSESAPDSGTAPRDSPEEVRSATSMALEGAAAYVSTKQAQRNTKEVWTATDKAPNTSLKRKRTDGNEQTKSVQGDTSVSENNKELNQLHSVEKEGDVTEMKSTLPRGFSVDYRNTTGRTPLMNAALNGNVQAVKSMIKRGADPSLTDNKQWNTLHHAASGGDTDIISLIHTHLPNIESKTGEGLTPLMVAAVHGKLHAVKWFLEKGATVACEDKGGWNTLHCAASGGDTDIISLIHTHLPNIESKTGEGHTPLMVAAAHGKLHAVKWFLEKGATVACEDKRGWNTLHHAASGGDTDIISLIHTHLPNIESKTGEGYTPLMVAAVHGKLHAVKWFLEKGATVACKNKRGWNTLHHAASGGDTDIISLIHTHLPNIESKTGEGLTPLMVAAVHGKLHAVKWFLEKGATVACENKRGWNTLHHAASGGDTDIISLIHTHLPNIESKTGEGYTPLMVAAAHGKLHAVKWFLEKGATVACENKGGWKMLHFAALSGDTDIISLIHTHLPNIESKTGEGYTPLMVAAFTGKLHAVKWFLEKGATVACEDKRGWNMLHLAAESGDTDIISLIHTHLPNIESKTGEGYTPLMVAAFIGKLHAVKWFLEKGATVACEDKGGWNVLHFAAESGDTDIISLLHTHLSNIESKTGQGLTPLMVAAFTGKLRAVKWLLEKGATVACEDKRGWSPLHHAAKGGDPDTIDLILTHLPDVDSKTADGETPLIIAVSDGELQGVKYLLERGANPLAKDNKGQDSLYHASSCDSDCLDLLLNHVPRSESTTGND
ncbi:ankyrin-2-like isoform X3 [Pocillopora verrucosa]|uniref:ankyrin-2-like isoform X3 n=1 Tax=Pocillopora verrucosa TaxID=203993 RepID=UPI00333EC15F